MAFSPISPGPIPPAATLAVLSILALSACDPAMPPTPLSPDARVSLELGSLSPTAALGKAIFFDRTLSLRRNQSCAACHAPEYGFTGPIPGVNLTGSVYMGSVRNRFGARKPPAAAYATFSPILHYDAADEVWVGGNFWDGRATGEALGNPAADQAIGPFLNPVEQALPDAICVLYRIATGSYSELWPAAWDSDLRALAYPAGLELACRSEGPIDYPMDLRAEVEEAYGHVGQSIQEYEASAEVNPFSSKFDAVMAGLATFTDQEQLGFELFDGRAMCAACHPWDGDALFTDFTYDNLGLPANPLNPVYDQDPDFIDPGLGGFLASAGYHPDVAKAAYGAMKVPTLRNVDRAPGDPSKAFGHNGVFKSLEQIVHFYNTRDVFPCSGFTRPGPANTGFRPDCWPAPEVSENVNTEELGDLGLTTEEEAAVVAFLKTLSDGWSR